MKFTFKPVNRILAVIMAIVVVMVSLPIIASAESSTVKLATISDIHYFDITDDMPIDDGLISKFNGSSLQCLQTSGILDSALDAVKKDGADYLLVSGDLTLNGEKRNHIALAERLKKFEADSGIQVIVTNGNHDINCSKAMDYVENTDTGEYYWDYCESIGPEEFMEIYADLGFDLAHHKYEPVVGWANSLSYSVNLNDSIRLVVMDAGKYTVDNTAKGLDSHETGGSFTEEGLAWVMEELADAKANNQEVIGMTHWNLTAVNYFQAYVLQGFVMDNWEELSEKFADAGMHYVFTGHSHLNDISSNISDKGEVIYSIQTSSLASFPNQYRENTFTVENGKITAAFEVFDCDKTMQVVDLTGKRYTKPYRKWSYSYFYCDGSATDMVMQIIEPTLRKIFKDISRAGLVPYIEGLVGMDFTKFFDDLLHGGLVINTQAYVTAQNVMGVINDIGDQIETKYIDNPDYTIDLIRELVRSFVDLPASHLPCKNFLSEYGLGSANRKGTLGEAILSGMIYMYQGNENPENDAFIKDVLARFESGELVRLIVDWAREYLIKGFIQDELLSSITLNLSTFVIADGAADLRALIAEIEASIDNADTDIWSKVQAAFADAMLKQGTSVEELMGLVDNLLVSIDDMLNFFGKDGISGYFYLAIQMLTPEQLYALLSTVVDIPEMPDFTLDRSILGLANMILGFGILDWGNSVDEVVDYLIEHYVTDEQCEGIGYQVSLILGSLVYDTDPQFMGDFNVTYVYDGPVEVVPTKEDYRLPSIITTTFGSDAQTEYNISWYTKKSLESTDIEIYESSRYEAAPEFTGTPTEEADFGIFKTSEEVVRSFFGVDIGVAGLLNYEITMCRHTIALADLKPNTTYYYRIGNAEYGWWSEVGTINTSSTTGSFNFIHVTDSQSQSQAQYDRTYGKVLESAFAKFPNSAFILHTGDFVDHGNNLHQWTWCTNASEQYAMKSAIMPVSGNHEGYGAYAISNNFLVEPADEMYDSYDGVYYSFDYDNAHFAILNTNDLCSDGSLSIPQYEWLKEDMANSEAQWKFVAIHKAVYSNGDHFADDEVVGLRDQLAHLMPELDIDMVFQGHDHVYLRTDALNNEQIFAYDKDVLIEKGLTVDAMVNPDGTVYVISGAAGVKSYVQNDPMATEKFFPSNCIAKTAAVDNPIYSSITIEGNKLLFKAYSVDKNGVTTEIDSFGIAKYDEFVRVGDTNLDGELSVIDAREALRAALGFERIINQSRCAADIDGDGRVSVVDSRAILRAALGIDIFEPEYKAYNIDLYEGEYKAPAEEGTTESEEEVE
ncbi:MAG TPA: hypothetical protein GXZ23_03365 [Clostridiales bacterium]|nr:hypothetical protein [Clostridiales bacterium]